MHSRGGAPIVLRDPTRGCPYSPPLRSASPGGGLAALVAITALVFLVAPHAHHLRPQVEAARAILAGNLPDLPRVQLPRPRLQLPRIAAPPSARPARPSPRAGRAVSYALAQRGKPYRWGAEGPSSFDCSGLTWRAWQAAGVSIPRTAAGQLAGLPRVQGRLQPGDLIVYRTDGPSRRHVAMVTGPGRMVEARNRATGVVSSRLRGGWLGAVRPEGG
jgi:peptidoglycan DL-endopeptidase CwlO